MNEVIFEMLLILLLGVAQSLAFATTVRVTNDEQAEHFLINFGYLKSKNPAVLSIELTSSKSFRNAMLAYQRFYGLNQTGVLDADTSRSMNSKRCGLSDKEPHNAEEKFFDYVLHGSQWSKRNLTYRITKYTLDLSRDEVDNQISKAFEIWANVTNIAFVHLAAGQVDIEIRFEREGHEGICPAFDGPGDVLAHAFPPKYGGDIHFDDDETWTTDSLDGTNLLQVAVHEIGHSLGLRHSSVNSSVMFASYIKYVPDFHLSDDDIKGIQEIYGKKTLNGSESTIAPDALPPGSVSDSLCNSAKFDAIFTGSDYEVYVFKGSKYWKLEDVGEAPQGFPREIQTDWKGLPDEIDAAFTWENDFTYFFKGSNYWRFNGFEMDKNYPKNMTEGGFIGVPANFDTAFVWSGNGKIYFFKGSEYWQFDPDQSPPVHSSYPKNTSDWEGLPSNIDAAFQYTDGCTYFFKDGQYWRFDDYNSKVEEDDPGYPRSTRHWWFGCQDFVEN